MASGCRRAAARTPRHRRSRRPSHPAESRSAPPAGSPSPAAGCARRGRLSRRVGRDRSCPASTCSGQDQTSFRVRAIRVPATRSRSGCTPNRASRTSRVPRGQSASSRAGGRGTGRTACHGNPPTKPGQECSQGLITNTCEIRVKTTVFRSALRNTSSLRIDRKLSSPTQSSRPNVRIAHRDVGEGVEHREHEREPDQRQDVDDGREQHERSKDPLVVEQVPAFGPQRWWSAHA